MTKLFGKISALCDAHPLYLIYNYSQGQLAVSAMSDQSDSQNKSKEQVNMSEGTSPSNSYEDGSRSTPSNLPKAATRQRKKRNSDSKDEDYVVVEEEASSKKKVVKKEFGIAASTNPRLQNKAPARRVPTSKPRKFATGETMQFTIEQSDDEAAGEGKKNKRARATTVKVLGHSSMRRSDDEDAEEGVAPAPKAQKLMGDAIKSEGCSIKAKDCPQSYCSSHQVCTKEKHQEHTSS